MMVQAYTPSAARASARACPSAGCHFPRRATFMACKFVGAFLRIASTLLARGSMAWTVQCAQRPASHSAQLPS